MSELPTLECGILVLFVCGRTALRDRKTTTKIHRKATRWRACLDEVVVGEVRAGELEARGGARLPGHAREAVPQVRPHLAPQPRCTIEGRGKSVQKCFIDPIKCLTVSYTFHTL